MNKEQKKRFAEVVKKSELKPWQKDILKICIEIIADGKIVGKKKDSKDTKAVLKLAKYVLTGKK